MSKKDDLRRALSFGKDAFYKAIQNDPTYQRQLEKVKTDYRERSWIDFRGFLPKMPTEEFERKRIAYQAKYGSRLNVPGFEDTIQISRRTPIPAQDYAAHKFATQRSLPSPLSKDQKNELINRRQRYLRMLQSPQTEWQRGLGAVATSLDNIEDAFVTAAVLARIAAKMAGRYASKILIPAGWVLIGADILNVFNIASWISTTAMSKKRITESAAEKNPFGAKSKAARANKLKRTLPTFGEFLEIAQTTDQLFGVGLCLGGGMGVVQDAVAKTLDPEYWLGLGDLLGHGTVDEITDWAAGAALNDYDAIKRALQGEFKQLKDEAYRLKKTDIQLRKDIESWTREKSAETWKWLKSAPEKGWEDLRNHMKTTPIIYTGHDTFLKEEHTKALMILDTSIQGIMPWWIENDPLTNFKDLREWKFKAPEPKDPVTIDILDEIAPAWRKTNVWPHIDQKYATIEELTLAYAPMIKDAFQDYCLRYRNEDEGMVAAQQAHDFTRNVIRSFSDDNQVTASMTAPWAAAEDMAREIYAIPPDTEKAKVDQLHQFIIDQERKTASSPSIKEIARFGTSIGINWTRSYPDRTLDQAAASFPDLQKIQDQLGTLFIGD